MAPIRCLIVDDEALARELLRSLVDATPGFAVAGECRNGREAVDALRERPPDVVFLDVQMPELSGFEVVEAVGVERMPVTVFVTAYDQYALRAFEAQALDYLLKPFDEDRLARALQRVAAEVRRPRGGEVAPRLLALLEELERREQYADRLVLKEDGRASFLRVSDIDWIEAAGKYAQVYAGGKRHPVRESITALEGRLDPRRFVRVNRSAIVHLDRVREVQGWFHGDFVLMLEDGTQITSSRGYRERLQELLGKRL
ncbi:MAG TPA: LytTR family DNA-binding domain-containing protein [Polyangiaceae bacterium]|nr:LytTR family DNA-binding domain-containing protein [Polyangiaceae bacterium]